MKTVWLILLLITCAFWCTRTSLHTQEEPRIGPKKCDHKLLESWKNWVQPEDQELFSHFLFLQHLENTGFNFCTLAKAQKRLSFLRQNPTLHPNELKHQEIWVEVLEQWVAEEELHWQETLPKFLSTEHVQEVLKKLAQWKTHCSTCIEKLPPEYHSACRTKGLLHRHTRLRHKPHSHK